jgi:twitching motility protein PilT
MQIQKLLQTVIDQKASDLHLAVGRPPCIRKSGRLIPLKTKVLTNEDTVALMKSITSERNQQELQEVGSTDFGFGYDDKARFRVAVFKQRGNTGIVLRQIPSRLMSFEEIGLPPSIRMKLARPRGLILVTGPTGSGKTTTLATMVDHINRNTDAHIITIEDPIEYYHEHKKSIVTQREVGVDVPSFAEGLRRALRMDPDVILIGEMRDLETIATAITAAETGHLVFGTLHTTGCADTINRIIDQFPEQQQEQIRIMLSTTLLCVLSQALLPRADGAGVVAAFEIMYMTSAIANLIRTKKTYQIDSEIQTGGRLGMVPLDDYLLTLVQAGRVAAEEALARSAKPLDFIERLKAFGITVAMAEDVGVPTTPAQGPGAPPGGGVRPAPAPAVAPPAQAPPGPPGGQPRRPLLQIDAMRQQKKP